MSTSTHDQRPRRRAALLAGLIAGVVCFIALLGPVLANYDATPLASGKFRTRAGFDHAGYHLPVIRDFAAQWPAPDLSDYASATTPGYHLALAAIARLVSEDERFLRACSLLIGSALAGLLVFALARERGVAWGLVRALPLIGSLYFVSSAAWLLPDNAAWLLVLAILLVCLAPRPEFGALAIGGVALAALVLVRQIHIWAAAPIWLAWWLAPESDASRRVLLPDADDPLVRKAGRAAIALAATVPAFALLWYFHRLWGGMTPPQFADRLSGPNFVVPATILTVLALVGAFFAGDWLPAAWAALREQWEARIALAVSIPLGLVLGLAPQSSYHFEDRISHIWNLVRRLPTVAERSPVIALGALGGSVCVALLFGAMGRRDRWVMLGVLGAFTASQTAGALAWPRYYEPLILILVAVACARIERPDPATLPGPIRLLDRLRTPLVLMLGVAQIGVTVMSLKP